LYFVKQTQLPRTIAVDEFCDESGEAKIGETNMRYAIIEDGSKQYKAVEGGSLEIDFFPAEAGEQIELDKVLMIIDDGQAIIGTPLVEGAKVMATVVDQIKGPKLIVFKYKPKQRYRIKTGHRQKYVRLQVNEILVAN